MKRSWLKERRQERSDRLSVVFIRPTSCLFNGTAGRQLQVWTEVEVGVFSDVSSKKGDGFEVVGLIRQLELVQSRVNEVRGSRNYTHRQEMGEERQEDT